MLVAAIVIFAEKIVPHGQRLASVFAVLFVAVGIWVAAAPGTVPGLTQPGSMHAMSAGAMSEMPAGAAQQHPGDRMP
jgi:hypothetical protein